MTEDLQEAVSDVRRMAAAGDFTGARRRLTQYVSADPETPGANVVALEEQRRTLEVLESLEVIRQLMRDGKADSAAQAAGGIRDALTSPEYARLGVLPAALALLDRASDLSRRALQGGYEGRQAPEMGAFVSHLGNELRQLQAEQIDQRLHMLTQPGRVTSTLGDLLSRRTSRAALMPSVEPAPAPPETPRPAEAQAARAGPDGPVIGRILFAQEQTEKIAPTPQTVTAPGHVDMFDLVGGAALRHWPILMGLAVIMASVGYGVVTSAPPKFQSRAMLARAKLSQVSAPNLGDPSQMVRPVLFQEVLHVATSEGFNRSVSDRLQNQGWVDDKGVTQKHAMTSEQVGRALAATGENPVSGDFLVSFTGITGDERTCQALVGVACDEIRQWYFNQRTADLDPKIQMYTRLLQEARDGLDRVNARRMEEFEVKVGGSVGVSVEERIDRTVADLRKATSDLQSEKINHTAAKQEEEALKEIAERIPPFEEMPPDARLEALKKFCADLEKEHLELARKREEFGPEHPIQKDIRRVQEDLRLAEKEIEELERTKEAETEKRKPNPLRTTADSRVVEARAKTAVIAMRITALEADAPRLEAELALLKEKYRASLNLRADEERLQKDRARYQGMLDDLAAVRAAAASELGVSGPPSPGKQLARQELVGIAVGLVAGLVIGLGIAVALTRRRQAAESEMAA